jgi:hypothetical protein
MVHCSRVREIKSMGAVMGKVLLAALLVVLGCAGAANAIELRSSSDPASNPFAMAEFAAPDGMTKEAARPEYRP